MPPVVAVVGPTGSGKTGLAIELARAFDGEIINTDSLQVYRHLDIGTAKPTVEERGRAVHHLIDVVNPDEPFSAGDYVAQATEILARLAAGGRVAILCGGTGLYFRALTEGIAPVPRIPADVRRLVADRMLAEGVVRCHAELTRLDPDGAARLHPNDAARVGRALEVVLATGLPLGRYQAEKGQRQPFQRTIYIGWEWARADLYAHINARVETMLAEGWIDEVQRILAMGYGPHLKPLRSIGYREIGEYLAGTRDKAALAPEIQQRTRNYAKRQLTWFRRQTNVEWVPRGQLPEALKRIKRFVAADRSAANGTP